MKVEAGERLWEEINILPVDEREHFSQRKFLSHAGSVGRSLSLVVEMRLGASTGFSHQVRGSLFHKYGKVQ